MPAYRPYRAAVAVLGLAVWITACDRPAQTPEASPAPPQGAMTGLRKEATATIEHDAKDETQASLRLQQSAAQRAYDRTLASAEDNYRIERQHCDALSGEALENCRRKADADLNAAEQQADTVYHR